MDQKDKKIALVIGWGAVKCAASLGLLRVLHREGIAVDMVVASGAGSIFGSLIALGYDVETIVEMNRRLWSQEVTSIKNRLAIPQILLPKLFKVEEYFNFFDDRLVNERVYEAMGEHTFQDTQIPLFIMATEYRTGEQVVFSKGSLYEAVRASIALPLMFPPVARDGMLLADGFLSDPLPIGVAIQEGAQVILAMGFESVSEEERHSISDYLLHISGILANNLLQASYAFYTLAHHSEVIPIIPMFEEEIHMFDTHKVPMIIKAGEEETERQLPALKRILGVDQ